MLNGFYFVRLIHFKFRINILLILLFYSLLDIIFRVYESYDLQSVTECWERICEDGIYVVKKVRIANWFSNVYKGYDNVIIYQR